MRKKTLRFVAALAIICIFSLFVFSGCATATEETPTTAETETTEASEKDETTEETTTEIDKEITSGDVIKVALFETGFGTNTISDDVLAGITQAGKVLPIEYDALDVDMFNEEEAVNSLRIAADKGEYDIIIGCHDGYAEWIRKIATEYPDQQWLMYDTGNWLGSEEESNVMGAMFKQNEGSFLAGILAAELTESNKVGFVGHLDIPVIHDFAEGYKAGAQYINSDIEVVESYTGDPMDASLGKEYAYAEIEKGVDIIFAAAYLAGVGIYEACDESGILSIGVDLDQCWMYPESMVASMQKNLGTGLVLFLKKFVEGEIEPGSLYIYSTDVISLCGMGAGGCASEVAKEVVTTEIRDNIQTISVKINSGEIIVPGAFDWDSFEEIGERISK